MKKPLELGSNKPISFSFSGCGFLGIYHVGVAACIREYAPINSSTRYLGASAGSLAAMALVCDLPLGESTSEVLHVAMKARSRMLGPFHPSFDVNRIIYESLMRTLPDDAHKKANGRLYISVTRMSDGKNVIINKFKSKEELIKVVQCSCFIPLWSGLVPPKFNGISYIDGGCSDNLPILDENTITVSPFSGESDICPQDDSYNPLQVNIANTSIALTASNFYRISRILFPAHPEILSKMCQQGFDDCLKYLQRNNKISCTRCLAIHFTLEKDEKEDNVLKIGNSNSKRYDRHIHHDKHSLQNCRDCEYRRRIALLDSLPESVVQAIQEACDQVNKGIINWLFRHKSMKLLSILSLPYLLPIDVTIVLFFKIYEKLPDIQRELKNSFLRFISFLQSLLVKIDSKHYFYSAKFSCELSVKEFDYTTEENLTRVRTKSNSKSFVNKNDTPFVNNNNNSDVAKESKTVDTKAEKKIELEKCRKISYAGRELNRSNRPCYRRKSMIEMGNKVLPPERVISQLNFDFKLDVKDPKLDTTTTSSNDEKSDILDAPNLVKNNTIDNTKVLDIDISEIDQNNAIEIANKALDWEKEFLEKCHDQLQDSDGSFDKMIEITRKNDAVMAYYYTDENNKVKFTELFKIKDDDLNKTNDNQNDKDIGDGLLENNNVSSLSSETTKRQRKSMAFVD